MPRYRRYFEDNSWVFLTLVTADRRPWMRDANDKRLVLDSLRDAKRRYPFQHLGHVILDDHLHWMLIANGDSTIPDIVSAFKRGTCFTRRRAGKCWNSLWQRRYYDHILRHDHDFRCHIDYIHYNPVKHGYAAMACQYRWSSFHAWFARGHYDKTWGTSEPSHISGMNPE
ncbi:MAG: transposase [Pseudomonadota bacterium]|nr:MAG: transposase [Pseudomonadota bacterium]